MSTLREFVTKALLTKRIGFGDLRRLQRDILPDGITSREEAEILIALLIPFQRSRPIRPRGLDLTAKAPPARASGACAIME